MENDQLPDRCHSWNRQRKRIFNSTISKLVLIWALSSFLIVILLRCSLDNSGFYVPPSFSGTIPVLFRYRVVIRFPSLTVAWNVSFFGMRECAKEIWTWFPSDAQLSISDRRSKLYERMSRDLEERGAVFLRGGETSQSLSLSDLFSLKNGIVTPLLTVSANVASSLSAKTLIYSSGIFSRRLIHLFVLTCSISTQILRCLSRNFEFH